MIEYGIMAAMEEEMVEIKSKMKEISEEKVRDLNFIRGKIHNTEIILVQCGVGKVNAARVTQILIDKYNVGAVINLGAAGSANDELNIGDIVIGSRLVQHDFDITAFGHEKGYITKFGVFVESNKELIDKMKKVMERVSHNEFRIKIGTIASGDIFCTDLKMKNKIREKFNAEAIEMEGAAVAQVCKLNNTPFIIIRSISDSPNGSNNITFVEFLELASKRCADILEEYLK